MVSLVLAISRDRTTLVSATLSLELDNLFVLIVTLRGGSVDPNFRGFMIQGRVRADDSPAGTFFRSANNNQPQCSGNVSFISIYCIVLTVLCVDCCHSYC